MDVTVFPSTLGGNINTPPSKSDAHRALIAAALASGESALAPIDLSDDITATIGAIQTIGAHVSIEKRKVLVRGIGVKHTEQITIDCKESGSTLRFFLPIVAALGIEARFVGSGKLPKRTIRPLADEMVANGVIFDQMEEMPYEISGKLTPGDYHLPGNVSSQFVTGLLFALPLLDGESRIHITSQLDSAGYVDMTIHTLKQFGVVIEKTEDGYRVPGNQHYQSCYYGVESDFSNAAFWLAAGAINSKIQCLGLNPDSLQADRAIIELIERFGANVEHQNYIQVVPSRLLGQQIDCSQIPDLVPILAVLASLSQGTTELYNAGRLRIKESDRLTAITDTLTKIGADVQEFDDRLIIHGKPQLTGGEVSGYGDHRIIMAMAIAVLGCANPITIHGAQSVSKSYPDFFSHYQALGGVFHVVNVAK